MNRCDGLQRSRHAVATTEQVLAQLVARTGGRSDRTVHMQRHIAAPLGLPAWEVTLSVAQLRAAGRVETDPEFPALIRLVLADSRE